VGIEKKYNEENLSFPPKSKIEGLWIELWSWIVGYHQPI